MPLRLIDDELSSNDSSLDESTVTPWLLQSSNPSFSMQHKMSRKIITIEHNHFCSH